MNERKRTWYWVGDLKHKWNAKCPNCMKVTKFSNIDLPPTPRYEWCTKLLPPGPETNIKRKKRKIIIQTFLPYPNITESLRCLDDERLSKQRMEAKQILDILLGKVKRGKAWRNHPAVLMWKGYESYLAFYYNCTLYEWERRGHQNKKIKPIEFRCYTTKKSPWFGDNQLHASHRSNLLRENPIRYETFGWTEPNYLPYFWPTEEGY